MKQSKDDENSKKNLQDDHEYNKNSNRENRENKNLNNQVIFLVLVILKLKQYIIKIIFKEGLLKRFVNYIRPINTAKAMVLPDDKKKSVI